MIVGLGGIVKEAAYSLGYRCIHQELWQLCCLLNKEAVRLCLKILDPVGVEPRLCRRLQRKAYLSPDSDHN